MRNFIIVTSVIVSCISGTAVAQEHKPKAMTRLSGGGEVIIQIAAEGPFAIKYVNPQTIPARRSKGRWIAVQPGPKPTPESLVPAERSALP